MQSLLTNNTASPYFISNTSISITHVFTKFATKLKFSSNEKNIIPNYNVNERVDVERTW
jgi:hypothetical protein